MRIELEAINLLPTKHGCVELVGYDLVPSSLVKIALLGYPSPGDLRPTSESYDIGLIRPTKIEFKDITCPTPPLMTSEARQESDHLRVVLAFEGGGLIDVCCAGIFRS